MTQQHVKSSPTCNPEAADSRARDHRPYGKARNKVLRLCLLGLACVVASTVAINRAAATNQVPYQDSYQLQIVSGDGTSDQVYVGEGVATYAGTITVIIQVHLEPGQYDPVSNSLLIAFSGAETLIAANGDALFSTLSGVEVVPLDSNGHRLPPPFPLTGTEQITGGTGRFAGASGSLTFSGADHNNGIISVTTQGTISSVGSLLQ